MKRKLLNFLLFIFLGCQFAFSKEYLSVKDNSGAQYMLEMSVQDFEENLGQVISKIDVWKDDSFTIQPYYMSEFPVKGIEIKYLHDRVCEISVSKSNFIIDELNITVGVKEENIKKVLGEGRYSLDSKYDNEKGKFIIRSRIITYYFENDIEYSLSFFIDPETSICSSFKMSLLDGDIKVSDLEGNLYYLGMPVERVFEIKGKPKSKNDLWEKRNNPLKAYYSCEYEKFSFLYFEDNEQENFTNRVEEMIFNSDEYSLIDFNIGCGNSIGQIRERFKGTLYEEKFEFNEIRQEKEHRLEYHCRGINEGYTLGFVFDKDGVCTYFWLSKNSSE